MGGSKRMLLVKRLLSLCKNFYVIVTALFLFFILFMDSNDLFTQIRLEQELSKLEQKPLMYKQKIETLRQQQQLIQKDSTLIEQMARERYLLRRPSEDVYLIEEREEK